MVNTVLGPVSGNELGKTLIHEHFVFGYAGFQGDSTIGAFDKEAALQVGIQVAERVKSHGVKTIVDPTPNECGRNPELLREIAERTGLSIICSTGYYYEGESAPAYFTFRGSVGDAEEEIYELFMREITLGIANTGIKPGIIKLASSKDRITEYEQMFFRAAARAQQETGIVLLTHTQEGTMGPEQASLLRSLGADPNRIIIGHMCGNLDVSYHLQTLAYGVNIGFDRFGIQRMVGAPMDEERVAVLLELLSLGHEKRIMLSHDTVNYWMGRPFTLPEPVHQLMKDWHPTHLFDNIIPQLRSAGISEAQVNEMLVDNVRRLFGGESR